MLEQKLVEALLSGANTPWNLVRFTLGLGISAASLAMKSPIIHARIRPARTPASWGYRGALSVYESIA